MRSEQVVIDLMEAWKAEEDAGRQKSDQMALNQVLFASTSPSTLCVAAVAVGPNHMQLQQAAGATYAVAASPCPCIPPQRATRSAVAEATGSLM